MSYFNIVDLLATFDAPEIDIVGENVVRNQMNLYIEPNW